MVVFKLVQCRMQGLATGPSHKATVQVVMWCKLHTLLALVSSPESSLNPEKETLVGQKVIYSERAYP